MRSRNILLLAALAGLLVIVLGTPALVRALPGRYAYYLPEPLQRLRHRSHAEVLPTPVPPPQSADQLAPSPTVARVPWPSPSPPPAQATASETPAEQAVRATEPVMPTSTPAATVVPPPTRTPLQSPTPDQPMRFVLEDLRHEYQGWNNCGPATLAMALSYWGREEDQYDAAALLKPDPEDKNVSCGEMEAYARELDLQAMTRVGGTVDRLKALVRAGFVVIVETWNVRDARDQLGHYQLVVGYDDEAEQFLLYDSLEGPDTVLGYDELDQLWRVFNRLYILVYPGERWDELATILGSDVENEAMYTDALTQLRAEVADPPKVASAYAKPEDWVTFGWFSIGSNLTGLELHEEAAVAYDQARQLGLPWRMLWYQFGPYESYYAVGRFDDVIALADVTLASAENLEESYYWRGLAKLAKGETKAGRADLETALRYHPDWQPAITALQHIAETP